MQGFVSNSVFQGGMASLAFASMAASAYASEGPLLPEYTEAGFGNRMEQCAHFRSEANPLHESSFCRIRYSRLVDLNVVHDFECLISGFRTAGYPGWGNDLVSFVLDLNGESLGARARAHSSGYGGPYGYVARVPCDGSTPLRVSYAFDAPAMYGRQDNHGRGFALELGGFSR